MAEALVTWKENMLFEGSISGHKVMMDATPPFGQHSAPTPKELLLVSMGGCTIMDVVSLLKKHKQNFTGLQVKSSGDAVKTQPQVYQNASLQFYVEGAIDAEIFKTSIQLSLSKYCSVNAMISKVVPLTWQAFINQEKVGEGQAHFEL
jgi:putative redox protein